MTLKSQLTTFTKGLGLEVDWSNAIQEFNMTQTETATLAHCTVLCPICCSNFVIRFDKYWKNSNVCKHIRKHIDENTKNKINKAARKNVSKIVDKRENGCAIKTKSIVDNRFSAQSAHKVVTCSNNEISSLSFDYVTVDASPDVNNPDIMNVDEIIEYDVTLEI